jgi:hypothetical protein
MSLWMRGVYACMCGVYVDCVHLCMRVLNGRMCMCVCPCARSCVGMCVCSQMRPFTACGFHSRQQSFLGMCCGVLLFPTTTPEIAHVTSSFFCL